MRIGAEITSCRFIGGGGGGRRMILSNVQNDSNFT